MIFCETGPLNRGRNSVVQPQRCTHHCRKVSDDRSRLVLLTLLNTASNPPSSIRIQHVSGDEAEFRGCPGYGTSSLRFRRAHCAIGSIRQQVTARHPGGKGNSQAGQLRNQSEAVAVVQLAGAVRRLREFGRPPTRKRLKRMPLPGFAGHRAKRVRIRPPPSRCQMFRSDSETGMRRRMHSGSPDPIRNAFRRW